MVCAPLWGEVMSPFMARAQEEKVRALLPRDKKPQAEMGQAADGKGDGDRAVEMEPEAVARLGSFVLALPDEAAPGQFRAVPDGKEGERFDPHRFRQALDSTGPMQFRFQPAPVCPLPGLVVTAKDHRGRADHCPGTGKGGKRQAMQVDQFRQLGAPGPDMTQAF